MMLAMEYTSAVAAPTITDRPVMTAQGEEEEEEHRC